MRRISKFLHLQPAEQRLFVKALFLVVAIPASLSIVLTLVQVTTEEVEALLAVGQLHPPRLVWMELQTEPLEDELHAPLCLVEVRYRVAHDHEVVGVPHQRADLGALFGPLLVEECQVDVRQERRDHAALRTCPRR